MKLPLNFLCFIQGEKKNNNLKKGLTKIVLKTYTIEWNGSSLNNAFFCNLFNIIFLNY